MEIFMYNITLVCTRHEKVGHCNSKELYKIFESVVPQIIFEEIPPSYFDKHYVAKTRSNLESDTINRYLKFHNVKNIQVDSENVPAESFFKDHENMLRRIEGLAMSMALTFEISLIETGTMFRCMVSDI